jgi:hypothetical protein
MITSCSVRPAKSLPLNYCKFVFLLLSCECSRHLQGEVDDAGCNVRQNSRTASTYDTAKLRNPDLHVSSLDGWVASPGHVYCQTLFMCRLCSFCYNVNSAEKGGGETPSINAMKECVASCQ